MTAIAPHPQEQHPLFRAALALLGVLAVAGVIGLLSELLSDSTPDTSGTAMLSVDGVDYSFTPTSCFVSDEQFAAAGNGFVRGQRFWVSASNVNLDLSVGTEHALDDPDEGLPWFMSIDDIDWSTVGPTVSASASMIDRHTEETDPVPGLFELTCTEGSADDDADVNT
ncbi:MAG: hypothetical protein AAF962_22070 [Actinomycetota bacterium]